MTIFLLSIAKENNIIGKKNSHWLAVYNSINTGVFPSKKLNHTTGLILKAIIQKEDLSNEDLARLRSDNFDESDLELAIDFRKWSFVSAILNVLPTFGIGLKQWLYFLKMIVERQKFIVNSENGMGFSGIYKLIIEKLGGIENLKNSVNAIKLLRANSIKISGDFESALELYKELPPSNNSATIMMEMANCYSKLENYSESVKQLDLLIELLVDDYSKGKSIPMLLETPADLNYTKDKAISAYSDIVSLAEIAKAELFMVSGTLLGYCRISDFLPNDKDLDFGLIGLDSLPLLVDLALKSGVFHIRPEYLKGLDTIQVPFIHLPTGIWIDVFIYHDKGEKYMTGVDFQFGYRQTFEFSKFNPSKVEFHGLKTYIPSNFNENLFENFLNWHEPDVDYISHVESPSIMDYGGISHQMTLRFWLIRALQSKSTKKMSKVVSVLEGVQNYPFGMDAEILNKIKIYKINMNFENEIHA